MLRRSGLVEDCFIVCSRGSNAKAASAVELVADVSALSDVAPVDLSSGAFERSSDSELRQTTGLYRRWLRLWSVNLIL